MVENYRGEFILQLQSDCGPIFHFQHLFPLVK